MNSHIQICQSSMAEAADETVSHLRAMSNPSRLLMLCHLADGEKSVGELEEALGLSQAYVSQQLARLRAECLVKATRDGRVMRYRICDQRVAPVLEILQQQYCQSSRAI